MVGQDGRELLLVVEQRLEGAGGQLGEGVISGRKNRERSLTLHLDLPPQYLQSPNQRQVFVYNSRKGIVDHKRFVLYEKTRKSLDKMILRI